MMRLAKHVLLWPTAGLATGLIIGLILPPANDRRAVEDVARWSRPARKPVVESEETAKRKDEFARIEKGWGAAQVEEILGDVGLARQGVNGKFDAMSYSWFYDCGVIITVHFDGRLIVTAKQIQVLTETMSLKEAKEFIDDIRRIRWGARAPEPPAF